MAQFRTRLKNWRECHWREEYIVREGGCPSINMVLTVDTTMLVGERHADSACNSPAVECNKGQLTQMQLFHKLNYWIILKR